MEWDSIVIDGIKLPGDFRDTLRFEDKPIPLRRTEGTYQATGSIQIQIPVVEFTITFLPPLRPRWGMRGRGRKRKERLVARALSNCKNAAVGAMHRAMRALETTKVQVDPVTGFVTSAS